jgi:hypothetical protein
MRPNLRVVVRMFTGLTDAICLTVRFGCSDEPNESIELPMGPSARAAAAESPVREFTNIRSTLWTGGPTLS